MKKWMIKAAVQGSMSLLPYSTGWNYFFQKYVSKNMDIKPDRDFNRISWGAKHLENHQRFASGQGLPTTVLELGTGWFPFIPMSMFLRGVDHILTIDIVRLLRHENVIKTLGFLDLSIQNGKIEGALPRIVPERASHLRQISQQAASLTVDQILEALQIEYVVGDARQSAWPDASIDLIISNTTLEHIAEPILNAIFKEFRRLIKSDGIMSHLIDMSDHYSHFDRSINSYNFLKYNEARWRWFNNDLQYQNRLRIDAYRAIHQAAGFAILDEESKSGQPNDLQGLTLAPPFAEILQEELLVYNSWITSRPQ